MNNFKAIQASIISHKYLRHLTLASLAILASFNVQAVGFDMLNISGHDQREIAVGVWYPTHDSEPTSINSLFNQALTENADIHVTAAPLVVLSHGFGGWLGGHADTALVLANAGFVVAAPSHTGNTFRDMSSSTDQWLLDRPKHIITVIDYMQQQWRHHSVVQNSKVGVFGFSAGGQTALSLVGAVPNIALGKTLCDSNPNEFVCKEGLVQDMLDADMQDLPPTAWGSDNRISAAAIAAPGLGLLYDNQGLKNINTPVQLWAGLLDKRVAFDSNVQGIAEALGELSDNHWIKDAGHFSFMIQSCTEKLKEFEPETWDFLCVDKEGFDRRAFHDDMNAEVADFFKKHLLSN